MCVCVCVCVHVSVCVFHIILHANCFGRTVLYVCTKYQILVNMHHVSAQGVDEQAHDKSTLLLFHRTSCSNSNCPCILRRGQF